MIAISLIGFTTHDLPVVNACLNSIATVLLVTGYVLIRRGAETAHKRVMLSAFGVSNLFLVSYLVYHYTVGHVAFTGPSPVREIYYGMLFTHVVLAATVPFLAIATIWLGFRDRRQSHRRLARWTLPIWLYVSITGVIVYVMLYQVYRNDEKTDIMPPDSVSSADQDYWNHPRETLR